MNTFVRSSFADELAALRVIFEALEPLDETARQRILTWVGQWREAETARALVQDQETD